MSRSFSSPLRPVWRSPWLAAATLIVLGLLAYANSLRTPFVYDDIPAITENASIRHLWPLTDVLMPAVGGGNTISGRPLLNVSFALNYAISGDSPWSYHVVNLAIHLGCGLVLLGLCRRTLGRRYSAASAGAMALAIAAVWLVHPLNTQAVTYTVQRAEALMALFYLLTIYAFARATTDDTAAAPKAPGGRSRSSWLAASVVFGLCGMATKEVMATAPVLVLLYDRTFVAGSLRAAWRRRRTYYVALASTWILLAVLVLATGGTRGGTVGFGVGVPWWAYGLTQFQAVARYLLLGVWPTPLVFEYGPFWATRAADVLPYALLVVPLLGAAAVGLWRSNAAGFAGAAFFLILAPTSLTPGTIQMIVEHRPYLPLAAALAIVVVATRTLLGQRALFGVTAAVLAGVALTAQRNAVYRSPLALWSDTVAKRPDNARAREPLAEAFERDGDPTAALAQRIAAVKLQPNEAQFHYNLAASLIAAHRLAEAVDHYRIAVRLDPNEPRAHNNLGLALLEQNEIEAALPHFSTARRLAPADPVFRRNQARGLTLLGNALLAKGRTPEAIRAFREAIQVDGEDSNAFYGYGSALVAAGRTADAVTAFSQAVRLAPSNADAHFQLGNALMRTGNVPGAVSAYQTAVRLNPRDAEAHHNLGVAFARQDRYTEAAREFEAALAAKPDYAEARRHLEQLRAEPAR